MDLRHQSSAMRIIKLGEKTHTPVVYNESREPHTSQYPSRPVTKKTTNKLLIPATGVSKSNYTSDNDENE